MARFCFPLPVLALVSSAAITLAPAAVQPDEPIDINTATAEQLIELPRIGEVTAARIIAWREENGPFTSTEELMNVQGIGERIYERIEPHVTVGDGPGKELGQSREARGTLDGRKEREGNGAWSEIWNEMPAPAPPGAAKDASEESAGRAPRTS